MTAATETNEALVHSILHYLHRAGFTKTLKRFLSEAHIQDDSWKTSAVNLEDVYCKYVNDGCKTEDKVVVESETKSKKKKKNKHDSASGDEVKETKTEAPKKTADVTSNGLEVNEPKKKEKKKKSKEQEVCTKGTEKVVLNAEKEEKKSSKKRKRLLSDENGHQSKEEEPDKETEIDEIKAPKVEKSEVNGGEKSGTQKSGKKQRIGSAEPKTINAFQRVKIDQVEFAHEKLQDNSYWAKDGADVGYGAKAEEVLGQVRGRDFRHEKTKKKRGSYRGGQIDLQSHSIKFNYSDEE
ncbi:hypothetical protein QVD17_26217 [Tagetes erecta]|uniref:Srp40 C-terminal domain-containing protein n=1 Tax=Tagetes erecta TaxID=13708 RepID=A0AAD8K638_TARER|nr:hypothetical protein QVD17_26217 [Tagetes erecta]